MDEGILVTIGNVGIFAAAIAATVLVISYSVFAKFWKTEGGQNTFTFLFVLAFILDHSALSLWLGGYLFRDWVRAIAFPAFAGLVTWRLILLWKVQFSRRVVEILNEARARRGK